MTFSTDGMRRWLWPATLVYLAIPAALFLLGTLRAPAGIALTAALGLSVWHAACGGSRGSNPPSREMSAGALAVAALPVAAAFASGAFGMALDQQGDWAQRLEVLNDLIRQPWPVAYQTDAGPVAQVYYIGWFLPTALVASAWGWTAGMGTLLLWSLAGFGLATAWLIVLARAHPILATSVFIGFSGIEIWQNLYEDGIWNTLEEVVQGDTFGWQQFFWYHPTREAFAVAPTHAIGGWLLAGSLLDAADRRDPAFPAVLFVGLVLLWSPFVALGVLPLCAAQWLCADGSTRERLRAQLNTANLAGGLVALAIFSYYAARWFPYELPGVYLEGVTRSHNGLWLTKEGVDAGDFLRTWAIFCTVHVLVLALPVLAAARFWPHLGTRSGTRPEGRTVLVLAATLVLLALPFFRYGYYNDLPRNAAMPAQFVLLVGAANLLAGARRHPLAAASLALFLALGMLTTTARSVRYAKGVRNDYEHSTWLEPSTRDVFQRQLLMLERGGRKFDRITQYLGSLESPFFRYLARESQPRVIETPHPPESGED